MGEGRFERKAIRFFEVRIAEENKRIDADIADNLR